MGGCQLGETIDSIGESMVKPAVTVAYNWPFIVQRCGREQKPAHVHIMCSSGKPYSFGFC